MAHTTVCVWCKPDWDWAKYVTALCSVVWRAVRGCFGHMVSEHICAERCSRACAGNREAHRSRSPQRCPTTALPARACLVVCPRSLRPSHCHEEASHCQGPAASLCCGRLPASRRTAHRSRSSRAAPRRQFQRVRARWRAHDRCGSRAHGRLPARAESSDVAAVQEPRAAAASLAPPIAPPIAPEADKWRESHDAARLTRARSTKQRSADGRSSREDDYSSMRAAAAS